jgi:hypothetical protein
MTKMGEKKKKKEKGKKKTPMTHNQPTNQPTKIIYKKAKKKVISFPTKKLGECSRVFLLKNFTNFGYKMFLLV